jgi:hypothetical protein
MLVASKIINERLAWGEKCCGKCEVRNETSITLFGISTLDNLEMKVKKMTTNLNTI